VDLYTVTKTINISELTHWYQPIQQLETGAVFGYEALVRSKTSYDFSPLELFKEVEAKGIRTYLDCQLLFRAINSMSQISPYTLFLNVFPSTLLEKWFLSWWDEYINVTSPLVLELSEVEPVKDWEALKTLVNELHKRGVEFALDDMGSGYCFFQHWVELNPEYIKLDRYYAVNLAKNELKQRILEHLLKLFEGYTEVILEGVETEEDLNVAKSIGIPCAQGYLLGKPSPWKDISISNHRSK